MTFLGASDRLLPDGYYVVAEVCGPRFGPVRSVDRSGTQAGQHVAQQPLEWRGAVVVPGEIGDAVGDAGVLAVCFAPLLRAAPPLRSVCVARAGLENVEVAAATARGVDVAPVSRRKATAVAELAVRLILAKRRHADRDDASVKADGGLRRSRPGERRRYGRSGARRARPGAAPCGQLLALVDNAAIATFYAGDATTTMPRSARLVAGAIAEFAASGLCRGGRRPRTEVGVSVGA